MNITRKLTAGLLVVGLLASCGGSGDSDESSAESEKSTSSSTTTEVEAVTLDTDLANSIRDCVDLQIQIAAAYSDGLDVDEGDFDTTQRICRTVRTYAEQDGAPEIAKTLNTYIASIDEWHQMMQDGDTDSVQFHRGDDGRRPDAAAEEWYDEIDDMLREVTAP